MGSYSSLRFDDIDVWVCKSVVPDTFVSLFQERDRRVIPARDPADEDEDDDLEQTIYVAPRDVVLHRLSVMGFTSHASRRAFEDWRAGEREMYEEWVEEGSDWAQSGADAIRLLTYEEWNARVSAILRNRFDLDIGEEEVDEIEKKMRSREGEWLFFEADDQRTVIRALLDACPDVQDVILDISDLIEGGWLEEGAQVCRDRREPGALIRPALEPTIIMAEGSSDIRVLRHSLKALYPDLTEYFSFFEHEELSVDGGASYLVKFLKAFAAARMPPRIIAIFDNDTAGLQAFETARALNLPSNFRVLRLPDIEIARAYPTIGPQGEHEVNVNGRAASIELYLGSQNFQSPDGRVIPVRWTGYVSAANEYQGAIENKAEVVRAFERELATINDPLHARTLHPELVAIWEMIFAALEQ